MSGDGTHHCEQVAGCDAESSATSTRCCDCRRCSSAISADKARAVRMWSDISNEMTMTPATLPCSS